MQNVAEILESHKRWSLDRTQGQRANLRYADLHDADLRYADLHDADLRDADLRDADLSHADLSHANLRYADLSHANLRYADLRYADLRYADLRYADLSYADLRDADLSHADLHDADLRYADLRYADLSHANLRYAIGDGKVIRSLHVTHWPIVYTDSVLAIGCQQHFIADWLQFTEDQIDEMDASALSWWITWKPTLVQIMRETGVDV